MPRTRARRSIPDILRRAAELAVGPATAAILGTGLLFVQRDTLPYPHAFAATFFGLITVYAAFTSGTLGGIIAGGVGWAFLLVLVAKNGIPLTFEEHDRILLIVMAFALPAVSLLVGWLRRRGEQDTARLREAEQMWRLLAQHVPDVVMTVRRDGTVHYVNRPIAWAVEQKGAVTGRMFVTLLPQEHQGQARKMLGRAFTSGGESAMELRMPGAGGESKMFELRIVPVRRDGATFAALASFTDIGRRASQEESHERLAAIVRASDAAIFGTSADGTITSWNQGARRVYGYSSDEIVGKNLTALLPEGLAAEQANQLIERAAKGERLDHVETVHRRKDGSTTDVAVTVSPIGEAGKFAGLSVVARDLTSRKRAEEDRRRSMELLAEAERIAHVGSWEWDTATERMTWTDELYRIYGLEPGAEKPSLGAYLRQIDTEDRERVKRAVMKAREEAASFSFDHRITRPDGEPRILRAHGALQRDAAGKPARLIVTVHDVTAYRRMEEQLRARGKDLSDEVRRSAETLRAAELKLKAVLDEAPLILWATDKDGVLTLSEGRGLAGLGIKPGSHVGMSVFELYKDETAIIDNHRRALKGDTVRGTLLFQGHALEVTNLPLKDKDGAIIGVMGVAVDVTGKTLRTARKKNGNGDKVD